MRPADLAVQLIPSELSALDAIPPAIVVALAFGYFVMRWRQREADTRDKVDASTWKRMSDLNEALIAQRDDALVQIEKRDQLIRQQADHIGDLEQRNDELRADLRDALRQIHHQERETP